MYVTRSSGLCCVANTNCCCDSPALLLMRWRILESVLRFRKLLSRLCGSRSWKDDSLLLTYNRFFFGQAFGGLILPPYTESFGRRPANLVACVGYVVFSIIVGAGDHLAAAIIGRFGCGFLSALPTVVGSGSIEDLWDVRQRIWAIDIWIKGSIVGIAVGPTVGVYISSSSLRWSVNDVQQHLLCR
jgi:MFS family permease